MGAALPWHPAQPAHGHVPGLPDQKHPGGRGRTQLDCQTCNSNQMFSCITCNPIQYLYKEYFFICSACSTHEGVVFLGAFCLCWLVFQGKHKENLLFWRGEVPTDFLSSRPDPSYLWGGLDPFILDESCWTLKFDRRERIASERRLADNF